MKRYCFSVVAFTLLNFTCFHHVSAGETQIQDRVASKNTQPRNIILMIGDGMGISTVTAGKVGKGRLALEDFPVGGFVATWSEDNFVTDSAAGATAYATGKKTHNGYLSLTVDGKILRTIVEEARVRGMKTGIVATSMVTDATPAAFISHHSDRDCVFDIAQQEAVSGVDLLMGGGRKHFLPYDANDNCGIKPCEEETGKKNLIHSMKSNGYCYLESLGDGRSDNCKKLLVLLAECDMEEAPKRKPTLAEMTHFALGFLSEISKNGNAKEDEGNQSKKNQGFFLMVEGSQIDWAGHARDSSWQIEEMVDFDGAVASAYTFAKERGDTLVVVTADHETGGYALTDGDLSKRKVTGKFLSKHHSAQMVPVFAYGPGSEDFGGIHDNTEIGRLLFSFVTTKPRESPESPDVTERFMQLYKSEICKRLNGMRL